MTEPTPRRRASDKRTRRDRAREFFDRWVALYVAVVVTIAAIGTGVYAGSVISTRAKVGTTALESAYDLRVQQRSTCERQNANRRITISNLRYDVKTFRADALLGEQILHGPPSPLDPFLRGFVAAHHHAIAHKRLTIHRMIETNAAIAVAGHPLLTDCAGQYPLPEQRGDPLPDPTVTSG